MITEILVLITILSLASLAGTISATIIDCQSSTETLVIGPSGAALMPHCRESSKVPRLNPPNILPGNEDKTSLTQPGGSQTKTIARYTGPPSPSITSPSAQSSASEAFDDPNRTKIIITVDGTTLYYSKETVQSLSTDTTPTTITSSK